MNNLKEYNISFFGLKEGLHQFEYKIENEFFESFNYHEFLSATVLVNVKFTKKSNLLELHFAGSGDVEISCDVSNEPYNQPIACDLDLVVKFGEEFNDDNEEILILPHGEHQLNVAQFIYEMIVLSVPNKRVHPGIVDGTLQSEVLKKLKELEPKENKNLNEIDPRWEGLKKLLTDNKNT